MNTIWAFNKTFVLKRKFEEPNYKMNISYNLATFTLMVDFGKTTFSKEKNDNDMGSGIFFQCLDVDSLTLP
jgi:hypothetical protein